MKHTEPVNAGDSYATRARVASVVGRDSGRSRGLRRSPIDGMHTRSVRTAGRLLGSLAIVLLSLLSTNAAAAEVSMGVDVEIAPRVLDAGEGRSTHRAVATFLGDAYVVWSTGPRLMIAIFDTEGNRIDEQVLRESEAIEEAMIVNDGVRLVVVWAESDTIRISQLTPERRLAHPEGILIGPRGLPGADIAIAGDRYFVIWYAGYSRGVTGVVLDRIFGVVAEVEVRYWGARIASCGTSFLLVRPGHQPDGIVARRVDLDGHLGPEVVVSTDVMPSNLSIEWNGASYLVLYWAGKVRAVTLGVDGRETSRTDVWTLPPRKYRSSGGTSAMAPHPRGFLVFTELMIWIAQFDGVPQEPIELHGYIVSPTGERLTDVTELSVVDPRSVSYVPSIARHGSGYFATWIYSRGGGESYAVRGSQLTINGALRWQGKVLPGRAISRQDRGQGSSRVVAGDGVVLAVWSESFRELNASRPLFARLRDDGTLLGDIIDLSPATSSYFAPSLACSRTVCLTTFGQYDEFGEERRASTWGRWISRTGTSISPPFEISDSGFNTRSPLATDGETFATAIGSTLYLVRPGEPVTAHPLPETRDGYTIEAIASNGNGFLLTFSADFVVRLLHCDRDGTLTSDVTLNRRLYQLDMNSDGNGFLLVGWEYTPFYKHSLVAQRISSTGRLVGSARTVHKGEHLSTGFSRVHWTGESYLVGASFGVNDSQVPDLVLFEIDESNSITVHNVGKGTGPAMLNCPDGKTLLLYSQRSDRFEVARLSSRLIDLHPEEEPSRRGVRRPR